MATHTAPSSSFIGSPLANEADLVALFSSEFAQLRDELAALRADVQALALNDGAGNQSPGESGYADWLAEDLRRRYARYPY